MSSSSQEVSIISFHTEISYALLVSHVYSTTRSSHHTCSTIWWRIQNLISQLCSWGVSIYTIKKNTGTLVVASKNIDLEINIKETEYIVMSGEHDSG
jgi:hypothetical protein